MHNVTCTLFNIYKRVVIYVCNVVDTGFEINRKSVHTFNFVHLTTITLFWAGEDIYITMNLNRFGFICGLVVFLSFFVSCHDYETDIEQIKTDISGIKKDISELQSAYDNGKLIVNVTPIENAADGNWLITFSDNFTIEITSGKDGKDGLDGKDGVTPRLKINENNYWMVSYDGGTMYDLLLDSNRNPIPATGADGKDGVDGADGKDGLSVRVIENNDGYYVFETYDSNTGEVKDVIETPYSSNQSSAIKSIVENHTKATITITMQSGEEFVFNQMLVYPSGIIPFTKELSILHGGSATLEFRINPSNAVVSIDKIQLDLVAPGTRATVSYITRPSSYYIESVVPVLNEDGDVKRGQYLITIKDCNVNPDYSDKIAIVIATTDTQGRPMEISSDLISISSKYPSNLPRVYVTTPNGVAITSKVDWMKNADIRIVDESGKENLNIKTSIRGRGNTTWTYPKKPYALKFDSKAEVLGMPKHKRWVLLANWMDRTLLRNDVAFEMARRVMEWAPRGKFVELYLNGKYQGNYYLCEQIKVDKNRVNVDELDEETDFGDNSLITGGYILEYDTNNPNDEINYFYTKFKNFPVTIKEPDEDVITSWEHPGYLYVQNYVNNLEQIFEEDKSDLARWGEITELMDVTSYIDWWLVHELALNRETAHPKSCYMYKKRNGKLYAGPVWDFDCATFMSNHEAAALVKTLYYGYLFKYSDFKVAVKERWAELKDTFAEIDDYILEQADLIKESNEFNLAKWPISLTTNGDVNMTFDEAIESMRLAFEKRMRIIDSYISGL